MLGANPDLIINQKAIHSVGSYFYVEVIFMQTPEVQCDNCEEMFPMKILTRNRGTDIKEAYFTCPHCEHAYISYRTNSKARSLQKKIQALTKQSGFATGTKYTKIQEEIEEKKEQLQANMKGLMDH